MVVAKKPHPMAKSSIYPEHPISRIIFQVSLIFSTDVKILQCLASQTIQFLQFQTKNETSTIKTYCNNVFLRVIACFAMRTAKSDVHRGVFAIVKQAILILAMLRVCALSVEMFAGIAILHCWESMFCRAKLALLWIFSAAPRSSVFFHWSCQTTQCKTARTKEQQQCSRDTPTHDATLHMTPTRMEVDSFNPP